VLKSATSHLDGQAGTQYLVLSTSYSASAANGPATHV
jgi:hypothetical protein